MCMVWKISFWLIKRVFYEWIILWKKRVTYFNLSTESILSTGYTFYPHLYSTICGKILSSHPSFYILND